MQDVRSMLCEISSRCKGSLRVLLLYLLEISFKELLYRHRLSISFDAYLSWRINKSIHHSWTHQSNHIIISMYVQCMCIIVHHYHCCFFSYWFYDIFWMFWSLWESSSYRFLVELLTESLRPGLAAGSPPACGSWDRGLDPWFGRREWKLCKNQWKSMKDYGSNWQSTWVENNIIILKYRMCATRTEVQTKDLKGSSVDIEGLVNLVHK